MADRRKKIGIGLLGSGVVGQAVRDFVLGDGARPIELVKIYPRQPKGKKWHKTHPALFTDKPEEVIDHPDAAIVVEALGFHDEKELAGFKDLMLRAVKNGKSVVTSDKAVLARSGADIWQAARKHGGDVRFEACVGGGGPIIP